MQQDTKFTSPIISLFLQAMLLYVVLLFAHGYIFGHQDQIGVLSYLKYLSDPTLYANDFYIQNITARIPNERWMFVQILRFFNISSPWSFLLSHFVVSMFLLIGLLKTAQFFIQDQFFSFLAVIATVLVFYSINLGGNEVYYNTLSSSLVAKTLGIWSIYSFLRAEPSRAILLLIPASLIHPIAGIQLFMIFTATMGVDFIKNKKSLKSLKKHWSILAYISTAGLWLYFLQRQFSGGSVSQESFFEIMNFRLAHHFIPSAFGVKNYAVLVPVFLFAWNYFRKKNENLFWFFNFSILGLIVFTIGVEIFHSSLFLSTQWFKTTIWLKFFSMIAISGFTLELIKKYFPKLKKILFFGFCFALAALMAFLFMKIPQRHATTFDMPWRADYNDQIAISNLAKKETPLDAVFVTPTNFTHLKYYGERSTYVDYKAMVHIKVVLPAWYQRIKAIYQEPGKLNSKERLSGKMLQLPDTKEDLNRLKQKGITHMITENDLGEKAVLIGKEGKFYLFEL
jgi:hypothetical protein